MKLGPGPCALLERPMEPLRTSSSTRRERRELSLGSPGGSEPGGQGGAPTSPWEAQEGSRLKSDESRRIKL